MNAHKKGECEMDIIITAGSGKECAEKRITFDMSEAELSIEGIKELIASVAAAHEFMVDPITKQNLESGKLNHERWLTDRQTMSGDKS